MKRLFNASPGFNKRSPSSSHSYSRVKDYRKLVSSESRFDVQSGSQFLNFNSKYGDKWNLFRKNDWKDSQNSKWNIKWWESQQHIKTNNSNRSRDDGNDAPKYKTLDDGNVEHADENSKII